MWKKLRLYKNEFFVLATGLSNRTGQLHWTLSWGSLVLTPTYNIWVVSTLIQSLWSTVGFCVHQSIVELHPIWSHYFECLSFLLCVLHWIVELCADSAVQCVRMCGRRRREELQKVDATLYYIKSTGLTNPNFLAGQKLNFQNSVSPDTRHPPRAASVAGCHLAHSSVVRLAGTEGWLALERVQGCESHRKPGSE